MESERSRRVEELFAAAIAQDPGSRRRWLDDAAGSDAELKAEVESLLAHFDPGSAFLARPAIHEDLDVSRPLPQRIGSFRVLSELGRGGMGVVYLAEQDQPRRQVALKVLMAGYTDERSRLRFEREAEILARLHHPGIAQIFEVGTFVAGAGDRPNVAPYIAPYIAMELVRGSTLTAFAKTRGLDTRERLRLFAEVCDAVDHAHRRGIVHRDLKPANVLVDESSDAPQVKVLDFGIARITGSDVATLVSVTGTGQLLGTLPYMSPEQASSDAASLDPRSDVYALGVLGYQLLCDRLPLDVVGKPLHEAVRIVREDEPTPASRFHPSLRGEIETILGKALEKDPARRYASAADLMADVRRHLADEPIRAAPPSRAYLLRKFARRNRTLVAGIAGVFLALLAGLAATTWQARKAVLARDRANDASARASAESRRAQAIARFQREMLSRVQPDHDGRDVRLADALDAARRALPGDLAGDPAAEGGVRKTLGESYHALGMLEVAEEQFRAARELLVLGLGEADEEAIDALAWLGTTVADRGRVDEAIALFERARADAIAHLPPDRFETLTIEMNLAQLDVLAGREEEGEALARANLARRIEVLGEGDQRTLDAYASLGDILLRRGRLEDAERVLRHTLDLATSARGPRHPVTLTQTAMLASVLQSEGLLDEPETLYRQSIAIGREILGDDHFEVLAWKHNLGNLLAAKGDLDEGESLLREVHAATTRILGAEHPDARTALASLAGFLERSGRHEEARALVFAESRDGCDEDGASDATAPR